MASPWTGGVEVPAVGGPDVVTLVEGRTFALCDRAGDMRPELVHGVFALDARILSRWELRLDGHELEPLVVVPGPPYAATFLCRGRAAAGQADGAIVVRRERHVGAGMRERLEVTNHDLAATKVVLELRVDADFAGIFEVKERRVPVRRPRRSTPEPGSLGFEPEGSHSLLATEVRVGDGAATEPGVVRWRLDLAPGETWRTCVEVEPASAGRPVGPRFRCGQQDEDAVPARRYSSWQATVPEVTTDHAGLARAVERASTDLGSLRIFDPDHPETPVLAAGTPWFMTLFGRDSLLTAWMALVADPDLARGVLETLARLQGTVEDPRTEEEPGRILHELRFADGEGPAFDQGARYYGTVDATPLFVMLLGELQRWHGDREAVTRLLPHADAALAWIERYGDRDGDGFVEYERRIPEGLANQGWKDSWDAVRHADGSLAEAPIALCEVQAYTYAAYIARAHLARELGDDETVARCAARARALYERFNEAFWLPDLGTYALALDAHKRPVRVLASNAGHCLWAGIVPPERARSVADRLLGPELFSGWGIRTLGRGAAAYNPVSYHNGSVWPHDNAVAASGLARYGLVAEAARVVAAQLAVAEASDGRLPELFAGFGRDEVAVPAPYPASCSPQAWAAAAPLLWLRTMLRLDPGGSGRLWIAPSLPPGIERVRVAGVSVLGRDVVIEASDGEVRVEGADHLDVVQAPRPPVSSLVA